MVQSSCGTWNARKSYLEHHKYCCHVCEQEYLFVKKPPKGCRQPVIQLRRQGQNLNMEYKEAQREQDSEKLDELAEKHPWLPATFDTPEPNKEDAEADMDKKEGETEDNDKEKVGE